MNIRGEIHRFSQALVMGILNLTPDSFHANSRASSKDEILHLVEKMLEEGADIIDIGAASSRPGADLVTEEEELARLLGPLADIRKQFPKAILSIDTFRSSVVKVVHNEGADIINDIYGGTFDADMFQVVQETKMSYIMMHMKGNPQNMQDNPEYEDVIAEILKFFTERLTAAHKAGINDVIVDPGLGFGKNLEHNYKILNAIPEFKMLGKAVLIGASRKSMINQLLEISSKDALNGTTVVNTSALLKGADILRVHDVQEAKEAVRIVSYLQNI